MSKEMIISVNGREKKIAILENGQATEFYIERGEENSGVVGNIYKGRVQRVLPGMQSAFVDIGLERDAFLYVSDFFDEQEEIERIVMEKSKDKKSNDDLERETTDELHKKRLKRDKQIDNAQEKAEITAVPGKEGSDDDVDSDKDKKREKAPPKKKRGRPSKKDQEKKEAAEKDEKKEDKKDSKKPKTRSSSRSKKPERREIDLKDNENVLDPSDIDFGDSKFERIEDDSDTGEMLKDAIMQEAITDKVRAIEFDMESTDSAEVGSLLDEVSKAAGGFERIADDDEEDTKKPKPRKSKAAKKAPAKKSAAKTKTSSRKKSTKTTSSKGKKATAKKDAGDDSKLKDAEASVKDSGDVAEMAARRGSRGGRRKPPEKKAPAKTTDSKTHNDKSYKTAEADKPVVGDNEIAGAEFKAKSKPKGNGRGRGRGRGRRRGRPQLGKGAPVGKKTHNRSPERSHPRSLPLWCKIG